MAEVHEPPEFKILGPLEVSSENSVRSLRGRKQRALLGLLLVNAGKVVSADRVVEELWGSKPPRTAAVSVRNLVAQLRRVLGSGTLVTRAPGYLLDVDPDRVDAKRFERLVAEARSAEPRERAAKLRDALALWRGPPLADLAFEPFVQDEIRRLEELRLEAVEDRIDAELALGRGPELVAEVEALVREHPLRERTRGLSMLALYRAGRQAEALDAYHEARRTLAEELGLDPSPALQELYASILRHEPELAPKLQPDRLAPSLPVQPTPLVGREREVAEVIDLLGRGAVRLLTLTGAGGSGKTRLALAAAARLGEAYRDGVWWIPLASVRDASLVLGTVAQSLNAPGDPSDHIGDKRLLLLLDNFEHVSAAASEVAELLAACPNLNVLVTSREPLHLAAEHEYVVPTLGEAEAVELFCERAHGAEPGAAVVEICRRLDCLPLAIELAAARTKLLSAQDLAVRLEPRLPLLTGGPRDAPERQRTLEATIAWSHDRLTDAEKQLFGRLAVFVGGCTLEAAETVCDADLDVVQSLVDKSLLRRDGDRYSMLETVREYAVQKLVAAPDTDEIKRRHATYYRGVAESFRWRELEPVPPEHGNFREAVRFAVEAGNAELAVRVASALASFFFLVDPAEGRRWLEDALAVGEVDAELRATALRQAGNLSNQAGDYEASAVFLEQSVREFRALGDERAVAGVLTAIGIANSDREPTRLAEARHAFGEALRIYESVGDRDGISQALHGLGEIELEAGNVRQAKVLLQRALEAKPDERRTALILHGLADLALAEGELACAARLYRKSLTRLVGSGATADLAVCLAGLSAVAAATGDLGRAVRLWGAVERIEQTRPNAIPAQHRSRYERRLEAANVTGCSGSLLERRVMDVDEAVAYALGP